MNTRKTYSTTTTLITEMTANYVGEPVRQIVERHAFEAFADFSNEPKQGEGVWRWEFETRGKVVLEWHPHPKWHAHWDESEGNWQLNCGEKLVSFIRGNGTADFSFMTKLCRVLDSNPEMAARLRRGNDDDKS